MKLIKHAGIGEIVEITREFARKGAQEACYSFKIDPATMQPDQESANWLKCQDKTQFDDLGIEKHTHCYRIAAIGECNYCGGHVTLSGWANECDCGREYSCAGQELADRRFWGEETGESF